MDDISEVVYVADIETHELLYLNDSGKRLSDVDAIEGKTCHAVLQRRDAPCDFCTNDRLSFDENYTWEHVNPITGHRYLLKDRLIDWEGRPARLEVALDMTASQTGEEDLRRALDAEGMVLQCAHDLYGASDVETAARGMLDRVGAYLMAERIRFFRLDGNLLSATFEWRADGSPRVVDDLRGLDASLIERWRRRFDEGGCLIIESVEGLPTSCAAERAFLQEQGVSSLVAVPLERQGRVVGFLAIENPSASLVRNIASPLKTLGYFFMTTVSRIGNEHRLTSLSFRDDLTGLYNRNRYLGDVERLGGGTGPLGILFLDVNDLKVVNDRYGHECGDRLLRFCAEMMRGAFEGASLYRIGGDEFVALAPGVDEAAFGRMVENLNRAFANECDRVGLEEGTAERFVSLGTQWAENPSDVRAMLLAGRCPDVRAQADVPSWEGAGRHDAGGLRCRSRRLAADPLRRQRASARVQHAHERDAREREQAPVHREVRGGVGERLLLRDDGLHARGVRRAVQQQLRRLLRRFPRGVRGAERRGHGGRRRGQARRTSACSRCRRRTAAACGSGSWACSPARRWTAFPSSTPRSPA